MHTSTQSGSEGSSSSYHRVQDCILVAMLQYITLPYVVEYYTLAEPSLYKEREYVLVGDVVDVQPYILLPIYIRARV